MFTLTRFLVLIGAAVILAGPISAALPEVVHITSGQVTGIRGATPEMRAFRGIHYAAPPLGTLRWRAPQPVNK